MAGTTVTTAVVLIAEETLMLGGGVGYRGPTKCPKGSYCRYFSKCTSRFLMAHGVDLIFSLAIRQGMLNAILTTTNVDPIPEAFSLTDIDSRSGLLFQGC